MYEQLRYLALGAAALPSSSSSGIASAATMVPAEEKSSSSSDLANCMMAAKSASPSAPK